MTHRFHTVILIYLQNAPIVWFSKKYNTVQLNILDLMFLQCDWNLKLLRVLYLSYGCLVCFWVVLMMYFVIIKRWLKFIKGQILGFQISTMLSVTIEYMRRLQMVIWYWLGIQQRHFFGSIHKDIAWSEEVSTGHSYIIFKRFCGEKVHPGWVGWSYWSWKVRRRIHGTGFIFI